MSDTVERYRKFCKIIGLHSVFSVFENDNDIFYNTSYLDKDKITSEEFSRQLSTYEDDNTLPITKYTILFITTDSADKDKKIKILSDELDEEGNKIKDIETTRTISEFDTMLWVNGNIYSLSQKSVKTISYNIETDNLDIIYSDDYTQSIDVTDLQVSRRIAVQFPLYKSEEQGTDDNGKEETYDYIHFFGQEKNDAGRNFVIGMYDDEENIPDEDKNTHSGLTYTTIIGKGIIASNNRQIIIGDFNEVDDSKFIVCNGKSDNSRKNLFTISDGGKVLALDDFVLSKESGKYTHKLSDIHDVINEDWYKET